MSGHYSFGKTWSNPGIYISSKIKYLGGRGKKGEIINNLAGILTDWELGC